MQNKSKYEKQIDALGGEITKAHELIRFLQEMIKQSQEKYPVYAEFHLFFYSIYTSHYDQLILCVNRIIDSSRGSLSVVKILKQNIENYNDDLSSREKAILEKIQSVDINKKMKIFRNKLGIAHLDEICSIDSKKANALYEENKFLLNDVIQYLELLVEALEILTDRLDISFIFQKPVPSVPPVMRKLFEKLHQK